MACMAYITSPSNGQNAMMPLSVYAGAMGTLAPNGGARITAASWQLDDGALQDLPCTVGTSAQFNFQVTNNLDNDTWHMITLYVWDDQSPGATTVSATFHVMTFTPPMP